MHMYKKEELQELQNNFARMHFPALMLFMIYLVVETFRSLSIGAPSFVRAAVICGVLAIEQAFRPLDYFKSPAFIFILKYVQLCLLAFFVMHTGYKNYEYLIYILLYYCIALENGIFFEITETGKLLLHSLVMIIPLLIAGIAYTIASLSLEYVITSFIMLMAFALAMFCTLMHIGKQYERFEKAVLAKERIIDKAMDNNKEIMEKQGKLYYVNEQLGIKRIELESANRKINANILEINIQNDMLHSFTGAQDIRKINEFFANKLITGMNIHCAGLFKLGNEEAKSLYEDYKRNNPLYDIDAKYVVYGKISKEICEKIMTELITPEFVSQTLGNKLYICENVNHSNYKFLINDNIRSFVAKALYIDGRQAGVYMICHEEPEFFHQRETYFDNILSELQVGMNNAFLYSQLENMAKHDGLTGLLNRRILNKAMEKYRHPDESILKEHISAAMFDIDNFKSINDNFGHLFGDAAIISVANTISKVAKQYDGVSYRYGGEEFVVMFFNKELDEVVAAVEEIHKAIRTTPIIVGEHSLYINTSAGISAYPQLCDNQAVIIDNADKAMYKSKTSGKGKITIDRRTDT